MKTIRNLKCILSEIELKQAGEQMAQAYLDLEAEQDALKSSQAQFKARIAGHEAMIGLCANKIQSGCEYRNVDCHEEEDGFSILTIRDDTGEAVDARTMTREEQQRKIPFEEPDSKEEEEGEIDRPDEAEDFWPKEPGEDIPDATQT